MKGVIAWFVRNPVAPNLLALVMVFGFGPTLLNERGWSLAAASSTTSIALWLMVVSVSLGGFVADRSGRRDTVLAIGLAGFAVLLIAAVLAPLRAVPAIFVGLGLFCGISGGPILSLPSLVLRPEARALGMGVFFTFSYLALMVSPLLGGWLAERTGDAGTAFVLGAAMLAAAAANGMGLGAWLRDAVAASVGEHQARRPDEATRTARGVCGRVTGLLVQAGAVAAGARESAAVGAAEDAVAGVAAALAVWGSRR